MQHLRNTRASTLYWIQLEWVPPTYELRSDDELFCTLRWSTCNEMDPASVVSADGQWTLMVAKSSPRNIVQITDTSETVAVFKFGSFLWHPVTVEFVNGSRFRWHRRWHPADWLRSCWAFSSEGVGDLISFKERGNIYRLNMQVDLTSRVKELTEAPLLAAFGVYILHRDRCRWIHLHPYPWVGVD